MAELEHTMYRFSDGQGGACSLIAIIEDTQTEPDPEGQPTPLVVAVRLVNTTQQPALGRWVHANGQIVTGTIAPGENQEIRIAPNRRRGLANLPAGLSWGPP
jgi:hypothetical protein